MTDTVLSRDIIETVDNCPDLLTLSGKTVFITGATGLIGSSIVRSIAYANESKNADIKTVIFVRNREKAEKAFEKELSSGNISILTGDITSPIPACEQVDYIIHCASPTSSKYFVTNPVETITTAIDGTRNVLEFAKKKNVLGMVYLSSLEVYGVPNTDRGVVTEKDYGYIDPVSVRSSYSEGKRLIECLCASYASEYNVPVKIARLSQTFGAGVEYNDGRVFAEFARCAIEKRDIVLHTAGNTLRTYCYTSDAIRALFTILVKGVSGEAYNITNKNTDISIKDMAKLVCDTFPESNIKVVFDLPKDIASFGYNPEMVIRLDTKKLENLGWKANVDIKEMFIRLIESMK